MTSARLVDSLANLLPSRISRRGFFARVRLEPRSSDESRSRAELLPDERRSSEAEARSSAWRLRDERAVGAGGLSVRSERARVEAEPPPPWSLSTGWPGALVQGIAATCCRSSWAI